MRNRLFTVATALAITLILVAAGIIFAEALSQYVKSQHEKTWLEPGYIADTSDIP